MSHHLSEDQFEACIIGRAGQHELVHINECPECRAELEHFRKALSMFRSAVADIAEEHVAVHSSDISASSLSSAGIPAWRWALAVTAFVAAIMLPIVVSRTNPPKPAEHLSPEAVMERLNRHLSRTVPAPMEPMMSLISSEPFANESGGVQ
jgi:hypothetical protein